MSFEGNRELGLLDGNGAWKKAHFRVNIHRATSYGNKTYGGSALRLGFKQAGSLKAGGSTERSITAVINSGVEHGKATDQVRGPHGRGTRPQKEGTKKRKPFTQTSGSDARKPYPRKRRRFPSRKTHRSARHHR